MVSTATAVSYSNSKPIIEKIEKIENKISYIDEKLVKIGLVDRSKNNQNNKIDNLKNLISIDNYFHQILQKGIFSIIGMLIGIINIILGLASLGVTIFLIILGYLGYIFGGMAVYLLLLAVPTGILSMILLCGGSLLLFINSPLLALPIIVTLFILFIIFLISKLT